MYSKDDADDGDIDWTIHFMDDSLSDDDDAQEPNNQN